MNGPGKCQGRSICIHPERISTLRPRERDVLAGIVAGCSNKVIAYQLGISPRTVEVHRANIMRNLEARHIALVICAAVEALRLGLYTDLPPVFAPLLAYLLHDTQEPAAEVPLPGPRSRQAG